MMAAPVGERATSGAVAARCARRWDRTAADILRRVRDARVSAARQAYRSADGAGVALARARALRAVAVHADEYARRCALGWYR